MQRIMVDLPEPEGPQTTTRSFADTVRLRSRKTCIAPNHLLTLSRTSAGGPERSVCMAALMVGSSARMGAMQVTLQASAIFRHGETECDVDRGEPDIDLGGETLPGRVAERDLPHGEEVKQADDHYQASILEEADEGVDQGWN